MDAAVQMQRNTSNASLLHLALCNRLMALVAQVLTISNECVIIASRVVQLDSVRCNRLALLGLHRCSPYPMLSR